MNGLTVYSIKRDLHQFGAIQLKTIFGHHVTANSMERTICDCIRSRNQMDIEVLKKYKDYTKPLTDNDIRKATTLIHNEMYCNIMCYMLETGEKLEQEIVSWMGRKEK